EELIAGPRSASIAQAQAAIQLSEVDLKRAELALERATLVAPVAGFVAAVDIDPGELTSAGHPVIVLADSSAWQLEAQSVDDLSIVRVHEGAAVTISFDAVPDLVLTGKVARVKPFGKGERSQALYTVVIAPDMWDE